MKTDFDYNSMPVSFAHCLNGHCLRADKCLRRQVTLRMPKQRAAVMVINPEHVTSDGVDCTYFIDENLIASITKRYIMHWMQKIRSFRVDLSFPSRLVKLCFSLFMNQFMQIRQTPNILFLTPT